MGAGRFHINTLDEEIEFVKGLERSTGRLAGIYPEIKSPAWHQVEGVDISQLVLATLAEHGYEGPEAHLYLQCFDYREIRRLREELGCELPLVQLVADNSWGESDTDYDALLTEQGIQEASAFVDGFGPWINQLFRLDDDGKPQSSGVVEHIQASGCECHPYTLRADAFPEAFADFESCSDFFITELGVDGVFTDFPDRFLRYKNI